MLMALHCLSDFTPTAISVSPETAVVLYSSQTSLFSAFGCGSRRALAAWPACQLLLRLQSGRLDFLCTHLHTCWMATSSSLSLLVFLCGFSIFLRLYTRLSATCRSTVTVRERERESVQKKSKWNTCTTYCTYLQRWEIKVKLRMHFAAAVGAGDDRH